ncbi:MAG TPA: SprT family zinc-dependent metalloprotease [Steroidobacteraceae bacterium]|nr:SprT family zinc-dependent metalloprotease [Steroidobacteraceae bacterium]
MNARPDRLQQLALLDDAFVAAQTWRVRPSDRARRLAVRVLPGGIVEIVVPRGTRPRAVQHFVARHRDWIDRKVVQYQPTDPLPSGQLPDRIVFAANAQDFRVRYETAPGSPRLQLADGRLVVSGDCTRTAFVRHVLQRFTMRMAHEILGPWLDNLSYASELPFERLQIRRQRTRWGSCSRNGTISLNACLLFQPPAVVRYLLIHELVHTRHMNHSRQFWAAVGTLEPRWRELDATLSQGWRSVPAWVLR